MSDRPKVPANPVYSMGEPNSTNRTSPSTQSSPHAGTSTYHLAKNLSYMLRPLVNASEHILRNTKDLVKRMADINLTEDEILGSYDVRSLFTSIPIDQSITICE